jgi:hypothetical protein
MGRAVRAIFESIGMPHTTVESAETAAETVRLAGKTAFGTRIGNACLLPRRVTTMTTGSAPRGDHRRSLTP